MFVIGVICLVPVTIHASLPSQRTKQLRTEEAKESLIRSLGVAMFTEREAIISVRGDSQLQTFQGKITQLDKQLRNIRVENKDEYTWIPFEDVMKIEIIIDDHIVGIFK